MGTQIFPLPRGWLAALLALCGAVVPATSLWAAPVAFSPALAVELQPLRGAVDRPEWFSPPLRPMLAAYKKRQWAKACALSTARHQQLMQSAGRFFFGMERKKADTEAIERFLDSHVRGDKPELEVAGEGFVPAMAWRSLATDACLRADKPQEAIRMVDLSASLAGDGPAVVALAVARAQVERSWPAAAVIAARSRDSLRVALIRALAKPEEAKHWLGVAEKHLQTGADQELLAAVRKAVGQP